MMNIDKKSHQRSCFWKGEDDTDSSSDDDASSRKLMDKIHKLSSALVLHETEFSRYPSYNGIHLSSLGVAKELKPKYCKKKAIQDKVTKRLIRKNRMNVKANPQEAGAFESLQNFTDSLMHDLKVARGQMFAHMREEMKKLETSRMGLDPKKKKKKLSEYRFESSMKPQSSSSGCWSMGETVKDDVSDLALGMTKSSNAVVSYKRLNKIPDSTMEIEESGRLRQPSDIPLLIPNNYDPVVSSAYSALHTVMPKPYLCHYQNNMTLSRLIPPDVPSHNSGSKADLGRKMNARSICVGFQEFPPNEHFRGLSNVSFKSTGFLGQNFSQVEDSSIGFPVPFHHRLNSHSTLSSLFHLEKSFQKATK